MYDNILQITLGLTCLGIPIIIYYVVLFSGQLFHLSWAVVAHTFNPSTQEAKAGDRASSRTARATQRNPVSETTTEVLLII